MTNASERDELRHNIATVIHDTDDDWGGGGFEECLKSADKVLQLITAYTESVAKRREIEARMDELEKIAHTPYIKLQKYYADRIAELQKEQTNDQPHQL